MMTFEQMTTEIQHLSVEERKKLITVIVDTLTQEANTTPARKHSILEFEGIGARFYDGIDAQDYVNQMRDEWDTRG